MSTDDSSGFLVLLVGLVAIGVLLSVAAQLLKLRQTKKAEPLYVCCLYSSLAVEIAIVPNKHAKQFTPSVNLLAAYSQGT